VIGLIVTFGLVLAAVWPLQGSESNGDSDAGDSEKASGVTDSSPTSLPAEPVGGGVKGRRITPGCKPSEESPKYEQFIDRRALMILSWNGMPEKAANLRIPVRVVGIEDGAIGVRFLEFPMREQYVNLWIGSDHVEAGPEGVFLVDPCSATIVEWPEVERDVAEDPY